MQKFLRHALLAVVSASPFVVLLALPFHDLALFRQSEPPAVGLHVLAGTAALLMLLMALAPEPSRTRPTVGWPVLALLALAAAGAASSFWADEGLMGITGSLEHGVGVLWFLETAVLATAASTLVASDPRASSVMRWSTASAVLLGMALQHWGPIFDGRTYSPYDFPEWIGMTGPVAAAVLLTGGAASTVVGVVVLAASVAASDNRAVVLVVFAWLALLAASRVFPGGFGRRRAASCAAVVCAVVGLGLLTLSEAPLERLAASSVDRSATDTIASTSPVDHVALQDKPYGTLWQRSVNMNAAVDHFAASPATILTGSGWGSFESVVASQGHAAAGRYFEHASETSSLTYWDGDRKARFHSHNLLMEAFLASGVVGGVLWLAFLFSASASLRERAEAGAFLLVSTLAVGGTFWFFVNTVSPVLAIALALTSAPVAVGTGRKAAVVSAASPVLLAAAAVACVAWGAFSYATIVGEKNERRFVQAAFAPGGDECVGFAAVGMPARQINTRLYGVLVDQIEIRSPGPERDEALKGWWPNISSYSCLLRKYADQGDVVALRRSLEARTRIVELVEPGPEMYKALGKDFQLWPEDVLKLVSHGPGHEDMVLPLVAFVEPRAPQQFTKLLDVLDRAVPAESAVSSWLRYKRLAHAGDREGSLAALRQAFERGLANLRPFSVRDVAGALG